MDYQAFVLPGVCKVCKMKVREELGKEKRFSEVMLEQREESQGGRKLFFNTEV